MNKIEKQELERMNGVDPYEDEVEDGVPMWLMMLLTGLLIVLSWLFVRGEAKASTPPVSSLASGTIATEKS